MMGNAVMPAYGRQLIQRRFAGWHPLFVNLIYCADWWSLYPQQFILWGGAFTANSAWLVLQPKHYHRGYMDFRCLAGAEVTVLDMDGMAGEFETPIGSPLEPFRNPFFNLLHDLAQLSGPLFFVTASDIYTHNPRERPQRVSASRYAYECKLSDPGRAWPWWWPESLDKTHGEKIDAWCAAARSRGGRARVRQRAA